MEDEEKDDFCTMNIIVNQDLLLQATMRTSSVECSALAAHMLTSAKKLRGINGILSL